MLVAFIRLRAVTALEMWWSWWIPLTFSHQEVGLLKTQQRPSTCPSLGGAFISCCCIPNQLSWPYFHLWGRPFSSPCPQSFHLSWEFPGDNKNVSTRGYCSRMPIFLKDPFTLVILCASYSSILNVTGLFKTRVPEEFPCGPVVRGLPWWLRW